MDPERRQPETLIPTQSIPSIESFRSGEVLGVGEAPPTLGGWPKGNPAQGPDATQVQAGNKPTGSLEPVLRQLEQMKRVYDELPVRELVVAPENLTPPDITGLRIAAPSEETAVAGAGGQVPSPAAPGQAPRPTLSGMHWAVAADDVNADYLLLSKLGQGGQGTVWRAWQRSLAREVAIKELRAGEPTDFLHEAHLTATLDHPNIVPVHDLFRRASPGGELLPAITMKMVTGRPWHWLLYEERQQVRTDAPSYLARHLQVLVSVCHAVAYAHSKGIIHRDLKPHQVIVGQFGEVYLMDWGLAVSLRDDALQSPLEARQRQRQRKRPFPLRSLVTTTNMSGTPAYMAPEQTLDGTDSLGFHTDIYLLGAILFHIVQGRGPHDGDTVEAALAAAHLNVRPDLPAWCPPELHDLIDRTLDTDPAKRPGKVEDFRHSIEEFLSGAKRRHQATAKLDQAEAALRQPKLDYKELSAAATAITHAEGMWPEHPGIAPLRQRMIESFARAALLRGDYPLARLQAARLDDTETRERLDAEISERQEKEFETLQGFPLMTPGRAAVLLLMLALMAGAVGWMVMTARATLMNEVRGKVLSLAQVAAANIAADDLKAIEGGPEEIETPEFNRIWDQFKELKSFYPEVRFIYTMRPANDGDDAHWYFIVDADPLDVDQNGNGVIDPDEAGSPPGLLYEDGTPAQMAALSEPTAEPDFLVDEWGTFVSGYAPVVDASGETIAILGVDITAQEVMNRFAAMKWSAAAALAVLGTLITLALLAFFAKARSIEVIAALDAQVRRQAEVFRDRDLRLG